MIRSILKMAWRSLLKNKLSSVINIGGLAVGLATSILVLLLITEEISYDNFHVHMQDIFIVLKNQQQADGISTGQATAGPMAAVMRSNIPEAKFTSRISYFGDELTEGGGKTLNTSGIYTDPGFFSMMSFPAIKGDPVKLLADPQTVLLTETTARKFFGDAEPVGKTLVFRHTDVFRVGGILKDPPSNSSIRFDIVLPFAFFEKGNEWLKKWDDNRINTIVQLKTGSDIPALNAKLTGLLQTRTGDTTENLFVYPYAKMKLYGNFSNGKPSGGRIYQLELIGALGLFILLIACINFMNLATARSEYRAREVGVRKLLGASRKIIICQFLSEAMLMTLFALALALPLAALVIPWLNQLMQKDLRFNFLGIRIWCLLAAVGLFTGLVAGSYPAFSLSRFNIVSVLKKSGGLRRVLVTFQFIISIFFIIGTIVIFAQISHIRNRPVGYDQTNLLRIDASGKLAENFDLFQNGVSKTPGIKSISAGSDNLLQFGGAVTGMDWPGKIPGKEIAIIVTGVQYKWIQTTGLTLLEGRDFDPSFGTDTMACLLNESAVTRMSLKTPVLGQVVGGEQVIGVVKNFVFNNPSAVIAPMMISLNTGKLNNFFVRLQNDDHWRERLSVIEKIAKELNPGFPFNFSFTKEDYQQRFTEFNVVGYMAIIFGSMAIFISCLGLFGLSAFLAEKRSKEMSIRKVLGASLHNVWFALSHDFLKPVIMAFLIVIPISAWVMHTILSYISWHITLSWWMFAMAGLLTLIIALLTVSYQGVRTAFENPVKNLRSE